MKTNENGMVELTETQAIIFIDSIEHTIKLLLIDKTVYSDLFAKFLQHDINTLKTNIGYEKAI